MMLSVRVNVVTGGRQTTHHNQSDKDNLDTVLALYTTTYQVHSRHQTILLGIYRCNRCHHSHIGLDFDTNWSCSL